MVDLERIRRDTGFNSDRERQINFVQKDLEMKLNNAHNLLREKESAEATHADSLKRLSDTVGLLKEENERLKREIKSIEELRATLQRDDMTASKIRENDLMGKLNQQAAVIRNYEK
jgi:archaellum biogenesis protein FlaJ (TadC family)